MFRVLAVLLSGLALIVVSLAGVFFQPVKDIVFITPITGSIFLLVIVALDWLYISYTANYA